MAEAFIETGTYQGGAVVLARQCGFPLVRSCEASRERYEALAEHFAPDTAVQIYYGDSVNLLEQMLDGVGRSTIWLDAHGIPGDQHSVSSGETWSGAPILQELAIIAKHPVKNHNILIDDWSAFTPEGPFSNISQDKILERVLAINGRYAREVITYRSDILACTVVD